METNLSRRSLLMAGAALLAAAPVFAADAYPSKPVKLVVGFPPGGPTDILGRLVAQSFAKHLGGTVFVENRGGAGGTIGANAVANSKADGYTLLLAVESSQTRGLAIYPALPYDQQKDFTYIRKVAKQRVLVVVNPSLPVNSLKELIEYAKANPGKLNVGGAFGTSTHIGQTTFDSANGTQTTFVNYPGGSQLITDLIGGVVQVGFYTEATVAQHIKSGRLKALAVAEAERSPAFPNVPTVAESGGRPMEVSPWYAVAGPKGLPVDVVQKVAAALEKMVTEQDFLSQLETIGAIPIKSSTPQSFTAEVADEIAYWNRWAKVHVAPATK